MVQVKIIVLLFFTVIVNTNAHITWIEAKYPLRGERSKPGTPWPLPNSISTTNKQFSLDSDNFIFESDDVDKCDIIKEAIKRYKTLTFIKNKKSLIDENVPILKKLSLKIEKPEICGWPQLNEDESYEIKIDMEKINNDNLDVIGILQSKTVWGFLRGLETFSQMVYDKNMNESIYFYVNQTSIKDAPAFSYRGYMIDTSRHFLPVPTIMAHLDLMSYNKLNVLHWHVVDDQSWPLEMNVHTELNKKGAFSPKHVYSLTQVQDILNYARLLGIRVLPELDSPGHTYQIPKKYLTPCYAKRTSDIKTNQWTIEDILAQKMDRKEYGPAYTEYYGEHGQYEILNPTLDETFDYMLELFKEFKTMFKDEFIHLGMDEVYYSCWLSNPDIIEWMKSKNMTQLHQIEQYYVEKTLKNIKQKVRDRKYQIWQDPLDNGVSIDKDAIIQIWKGGNDWTSMAKNVVGKGYQMVLSTPFYLNYIQYQSPYNDWEKYYSVDILSFTDNPKEKELVIGAEVCVWSEFVDATNSISRTWPRASAPAERFWSNPSSYDIDSVRFRLDDFRCLMLKRGYPVGPILNGYCGDYEWDMLT